MNIQYIRQGDLIGSPKKTATTIDPHCKNMLCRLNNVYFTSKMSTDLPYFEISKPNLRRIKQCAAGQNHAVEWQNRLRIFLYGPANCGNWTLSIVMFEYKICHSYFSGKPLPLPAKTLYLGFGLLASFESKRNRIGLMSTKVAIRNYI